MQPKKIVQPKIKKNKSYQNIVKVIKTELNRKLCLMAFAFIFDFIRYYNKKFLLLWLLLPPFTYSKNIPAVKPTNGFYKQRVTLTCSL